MARTHTPRFCTQCGSSLIQPLDDSHGGPPLLCTGCGMGVYLDPKLAVAGIVRVNGQVVMMRRAQRDPAHGLWILPGGHVDRGEVVREAAAREIGEETGLKATINGLLGVYSYPGEPVVLVVYLASAPPGPLQPGPESLQTELFAPQDIPWDTLGYRSTSDALHDWLKRGDS